MDRAANAGVAEHEPGLQELVKWLNNRQRRYANTIEEIQKMTIEVMEKTGGKAEGANRSRQAEREHKISGINESKQIQHPKTAERKA